MRDEKRKATAEVFEYRPPTEDVTDIEVVGLGETDLFRSSIKTVSPEMKINFHAHTGNDGFWYVLSGRARFYGGEDNELVADLAPGQGIVIPREFPYWYECANGENLEILHVSSFAQDTRDRRIDYEETDYDPAESTTWG